MAIDTAAKRKSAAGTPFLPLFGVTNDASKAAAWRSQVAWRYSGVAADTPVVVPAIASMGGLVGLRPYLDGQVGLVSYIDGYAGLRG